MIKPQKPNRYIGAIFHDYDYRPNGEHPQINIHCCTHMFSRLNLYVYEITVFVVASTIKEARKVIRQAGWKPIKYIAIDFISSYNIKFGIDNRLLDEQRRKITVPDFMQQVLNTKYITEITWVDSSGMMHHRSSMRR